MSESITDKLFVEYVGLDEKIQKKLRKALCDVGVEFAISKHPLQEVREVIDKIARNQIAFEPLIGYESSAELLDNTELTITVVDRVHIGDIEVELSATNSWKHKVFGSVTGGPLEGLGARHIPYLGPLLPLLTFGNSIHPELLMQLEEGTTRFLPSPTKQAQAKVFTDYEAFMQTASLGWWDGEFEVSTDINTTT